jgi:UPF0755 protein
MVKKLFIVSLVLLAIGGACLLAVWNWSEKYFNRQGPLQSEIAIIIPQGSSIIRISNILANQGVIRYPRVFTLMARHKEQGVFLKAGEYVFTPHITPKEVFDKLAKGEILIRQITIVEGLPTSQVLEIINNSYGLLGEIPEGIKEGELLPETYHYQYGDTKTEIIGRMRSAMQQTVEELWERRAEKLPFTTQHEAITLASIVEKETGVEEERKRVAAVFINRLRKNMRLQSDPTVIYGITRGEIPLERSLLLQDLKLPSEYNTYLVFGLPPGPISNPGKESIAAVLNPLQTNEYYFVADGTGGHSFAKTLEEHNANVKKWRRIQKENRQKEESQ